MARASSHVHIDSGRRSAWLGKKARYELATRVGWMEEDLTALQRLHTTGEEDQWQAFLAPTTDGSAMHLMPGTREGRR